MKKDIIIAIICIASSIPFLVFGLTNIRSTEENIRFWKKSVNLNGDRANHVFFTFPSAGILLFFFGISILLVEIKSFLVILTFPVILFSLFSLLYWGISTFPYPAFLTPKWFRPIIREHRAKVKAEKREAKETKRRKKLNSFDSMPEDPMKPALREIIEGRSAVERSLELADFEQKLIVDIENVLETARNSKDYIDLYIGEKTDNLPLITPTEKRWGRALKPYKASAYASSISCEKSELPFIAIIDSPIDEERAPGNFEQYLFDQGFLTPGEGGISANYSLDGLPAEPLSLARILIANMVAFGLKPSDMEAWRVDEVIVPGGLTESQPSADQEKEN